MSSSALRRVMHDLKELQESKTNNLFAVQPDPDNFLVWHCNFKFKDVIFHCVIEFPENYPMKSPSIEFLPSMAFSGGATRAGKRGGTRVCLSILSDFADVHGEWSNEKGTGWSQSYTILAVFLNLLSFFNDYPPVAQNNSAWKCSCGHCEAAPVPSFTENDDGANDIIVDTFKLDNIAPSDPELLQCYITKTTIHDLDPTKDMFGFGVVKTPQGRSNVNLTTPGEFLCHSAWQNGDVESVMREKLHAFLPLPIKNANIQDPFERAMVQLADRESVFRPEMVIAVLPKLLNSTVVAFMNSTIHTSDRALYAYFAIHYLFLYAVQKYPELAALVSTRIDDFVNDKDNARDKSNTPNVGEWLALLLVADKHCWGGNLADAYVRESSLRNVMWYVKDSPALGNSNISPNDRIGRVFTATKISRDLAAFQIKFLNVALAAGTSGAWSNYEKTCGQPTVDQVDQLKDFVRTTLPNVKSFADWYGLIGLPVPDDLDLAKQLMSFVDACRNRSSYWPNNNGNNGGRNNRRR